jgi:hypothetical protein
LKKYADQHRPQELKHIILFSDVVKKYRSDALPKLAESTIRIQQSDIKHVENISATRRWTRSSRRILLDSSINTR